MKKFKIYFAFVLVLLMAPVMAIFGQDEVPTIPDWSYLYENFGTLMFSYLGIAAIATFIGEILVRLLKATKKFIKVIVVMIVAVVVAFIGQFTDVGFLADSVWYQTALWGLLAGAAANGVRSGNLLFFKSVVDFILGLILNKEPKE
jgi:hypothetical protein